MPKIDELWFDIDGRTGKFESAMQKSQAEARGFANFMTSSRGPQGAVSRFAAGATTRIKSFGRSVKNALFSVQTVIVGVFAGLATRVGKQLFDAGAAAAETENKFRVVFGRMSDSVNEFLADFGRMAGLSRREGQDLIATTGQIAQGMGFARQESAEFSQDIVQLAGDLASFNDQPTARVVEAINSALTGERERLKQLGIVVREVDVQQRALNDSGKTSVETLTQQERALATLQIITERAGVATGDLAQTQDSAANRAKQLGAAWRDLKDVLGAVVVDLVTTTDAMGDTRNGIERLTDSIRDNQNEIVNSVRGVGTALVNVTRASFNSFQAITFAFRGFVRTTIAGFLLLLREGLVDPMNAIIGQMNRLPQVNIDFRIGDLPVDRFSDEGAAAFRRAGEEAKATADAWRAVAGAFREVEGTAGDAGDALAGSPDSVATRVDEARKSAKELQAELKELRAEIENLPVPTELGGERPGLRALRETLATLREEAEVLRSLADVRPLTQAEQQRLEALEELVAGLERARGISTELAEKAKEYKLETGEGAENVVNLADELERAARSMLDAAQAAGLLGSNLASALGSIINMAGGIRDLVKAIGSGGGLGALAGPLGAVVAGAANVVAGLVGGRTARAQELEALDTAIVELRRDAGAAQRAVDALGDDLREKLTEGLEAAGDIFAREVGGEGLDALRKAGEAFKDVSAASEEAAAAELKRKLTIQDLIEIERAFGVELDDLISFFETGKAKGDELGNEMAALGRILGLLPSATDRASRAIEQLRLELDRASADVRRFGVEDPAEQVRVTLRAIADSIDRELLEKTFPFGGSPLDQLLQQLAAIDVSSVSGARQAIDLVNQFIDLIRAPGGQIGFGIGEVGEEVEAALEGQLINLIETLRRVVEADGGRSLRDASDRVTEALRTLGEVLREQIGLLQTEFEVLDIEDPVERLRVALERLSGFAPELLGGAEIETVAGRRRLEEAIEQAFTEARLGRVPEGFERADFLALLGEIEGLLDAVTVEGEAAGETFQAVQIPQVTEVQFSELISKADTRNFLLRQIRNVLSTGDVGLTPPSADMVSSFAPAAAGGTTIGTFLVESPNIFVNGDGDAQAIAARVSEEFGRRLVDILRANGVTISGFLNN